MDDDNSSGEHSLSTITVAIIAIICAVILLLTYHCVIAQWCNQEPDTPNRDQQLPVTYVGDTQQSSMENSIAELLPSYKYTKDIGLVSKTQDGGTCSVCLCEFVDGEPVRVLPECLHPFHVSCIDTWLLSQSSCPLCRAPPQRQSLGRGTPLLMQMPSPMERRVVG